MRRLFLPAALVAGAALCPANAPEFSADKPITLRIGHPMAPGNNVTVGYGKLKELVEKRAMAKSGSRSLAMPKSARIA